MDRLIRIAWRTFWVGLGASAVLITQSLLPPKEAAPAPGVSTAPEASYVEASPPRPVAHHVPRT